jgi:hypothetical protein
MKALFGGVSLLIVLTLVGVLASRQFKATAQVVAPTTGNATTSSTVKQQSAQVQEQVRNDIAKAVEQSTRKIDADQ